jgi:hypothetical protein
MIRIRARLSAVPPGDRKNGPGLAAALAHAAAEAVVNFAAVAASLKRCPDTNLSDQQYPYMREGMFQVADVAGKERPAALDPSAWPRASQPRAAVPTLVLNLVSIGCLYTIFARAE